MIFLTLFYSVAYSLSDTLDCNSRAIDSSNTSENKVSTDSASIEKEKESKKGRTIGFIICFSTIGISLGIIVLHLINKAFDNYDGRGIMVDG